MPITSNEVRQCLRECYQHDPDAGLSRFIWRRLADPVKSQDGSGRLRISRLMIWLGVFALGAAATFIYFTVIQP